MPTPRHELLRTAATQDGEACWEHAAQITYSGFCSLPSPSVCPCVFTRWKMTGEPTDVLFWQTKASGHVPYDPISFSLGEQDKGPAHSSFRPRRDTPQRQQWT